MITEYYGNTATNCTGYRWVNHRGSWGLFFNNLAFGSGGMSLDLYGVTSPNRCDSDIVPTPTNYTAEVNNTYFFNNSDDGSISLASINQPSCGVAENTDFWNWDSTFDGSTGVGRGTSAPGGSATTGVGYWQANPETPTVSSAVIQAGHFWKATATDTWTDYYTPAVYPHPLRTANASSDGTGSTRTGGLLIQRGGTF
jgi:hypothetical protein